MTRSRSAVEISNGVLSAKVVPFGASLTDLRLNEDNVPLVLGYEDISAYDEDGQFMGAVIGRYANRIAGASFDLAGEIVGLEKNEKATNHLHGGAVGFGGRVWHLDTLTADAAKFTLVSPAGEAGYPGNLTASATYQIVGSSTLRLTLNALSDALTIVNMCHHPYFNFKGTGTIEDHELQIMSSQYLPARDDLLPTGKVASVTNSPFDFDEKIHIPDHSYNNTYCLHGLQTGPLAHAASLQCNGLQMALWTTQPGLHLYDGYKLCKDNVGHSGVAYGPRSGLCLEAQAWPDSPNQPDFPDVVLNAGETYEQVTEYRFRK